MDRNQYEMRVLQTEISEWEEQELRRLWGESFEEEAGYAEYYHCYHLRQNRIWTLWDGERLISMLHANPHQIQMQGEQKKSYFIVGVATEESYRRQGCMRQLMEAALETFRQEGIEFVYLLPAKEEYYLPFGFEVIGTQNAWRRPLTVGEEGIWKNEQESSEVLAALRPLPHGQSELSQTVREKELRQLSEYANTWLAERASAYVWRDAAYYRKRMVEGLAMGGDLYLLNRDGGRKAGAAMLGREPGYWCLYDVIGEELIEALETSDVWEQMPEQQTIMVCWLGGENHREALVPFVMEELA